MKTVPRKKRIEEINPASLTEPTFSEIDWKDFIRGIELFNSGKFWHAHEAWEQVWRRHDEDSRLFLQGIIQMAAAYHLLVEKRRLTGAISNFNKALPRLRLFDPKFLGIDVAVLIHAIEEAKRKAQQLEENALNQFNIDLVPKIELQRSK